MCYVYRYIDLNKAEVVYIGKVSKDPDFGYDPLKNRHKQHTYESWYKDIGDEHLALQYIEFDNPCDVDIMETWLISKYAETGQLVNKAKTEWGKSKLRFTTTFIWQSYWLFTIEDAEKRALELINIISGIHDMQEKKLAFIQCQDALNASISDIKKENILLRMGEQNDFLRVAKDEETK